MHGRQHRDMYAEVTETIIAAIEAGAGKWEMPWHKRASANGSPFMPVNLDGRPYRGINIPLLWAAQDRRGYESSIWGTYKAFLAKGAQVRRHEKATTIVFWSRFTPKRKPGDTEDPQPIMFATAHSVFNIAQADNYKSAKPAEPEAPEARDARLEAWFDALGFNTRHGGNAAFYCPSGDYIQMPMFNQFADAPRYYSTRGHEAAHMTGHEKRLNRNMTGRFGSNAYAAEELIAELSAAFLCAMLGIDNEPREDHAQYLSHWLAVLKQDKRAIFTAASYAQKAVDFMAKQAGANIAPADEAEPDANDLPLAA